VHIKLISSLGAGLMVVFAATARAGPLTFNTALPVSQGEGILRGDTMVVRGSSGFMDQDITGLAFPLVLGYGLTRDLTLFAMAPVFVHKSVNVATPMGRISRGSNGFGDMLFLGRYTLLEIDHPGSTFRVAPFVGLQVPTGDYHQSDRFGALPRPLQPGSGAWDPNFGSILTYQTLKWEFDADAGFQYNGTAHGFGFGNEAFTDQSIQYRIWPRELGAGVPAFLYAVLESNVIWEGENRMNGRIVPNTSGLAWYLDPGLEYVTDRFVLGTVIQLPVASSLSSKGFADHGLGNHFQVVTVVQWNFFTPYHF
jgi:outer membrane putative beta-barrel porin/alpha-amylase